MDRRLAMIAFALACAPGALDRHGTLPSGGKLASAADAFEERVYDYQLIIAPADLVRLNRQPTVFDDAGTYVPASVRIDGRDYPQVGVRYKGHYGTFRVCLSTGPVVGTVEPYAPDPANGCPPVPKFSYKISFDEYQPGQRFHGLRKINLHSLIRDPSKLHERLAYRLFREMGIAAPRSSFAQVTVNGKVKGIYAVTEDAGDRLFTADRWPNDPQGRLYKQAWPLSVDPTYWQKALATHKRQTVAHDAAIGFARDLLAAGEDAGRLAAALERWSDPEWLARYLAVDTAIHNADGVTRFSCPVGSPDACRNKNYFWYQTGAGKFLLLPWDLDFTWRVKILPNVVIPWDLPPGSPGFSGCDLRPMLYGNLQKPAACDPVFRGINARRPLYLAAVKRLLAHPGFDPARLHADVDRWAALIARAVAADPSLPREGPETWAAGVAMLKRDIGTLRARMEAVAAGQPFRPYPPTGEWEPPLVEHPPR